MTYRRPMNRHTMGQDWGGRRALNPTGCPKVSGSDVRAYAAAHGFEVKREGLGMWWFKSARHDWLTCGQTNYLALKHLKRETPTQ